MKLKYKSWNDITIEIYDKIRAISTDINDDVQALDANVQLLSILCDVTEDEIGDLPIQEFANLVAQTEFLKNMPKYTIEQYYEIGKGRVFEVQMNLQKLTTAQFIDFQTLIKDQEKNTAKIMACFLLPKGKKYGEDYDVGEVADYLYKNMRMATARSVMFFFVLQYQALSKVILDSSIKDIKKTMRKEKDITKKEKLMETINQMTQLKDLIKNGVGFS